MSLTEHLVNVLRSCEPRALIVDDDPLYAETFGILLSRLGCNHDWSLSIANAFARLESAIRYDILFLDVRMPGQGSWQDIHERYKTIPAIVVSGVVTADMFTDKWGHLTFLQKPVLEKDLRDVFAAHNIRLPQAGECVCR